MALTPNLPPQAYTRDTLVKAIEWLTTQPAAVRERANSADLIVSHYLAARRRTPFAGETAAADFRTLADDLRQLDQPALPAFDHDPEFGESHPDPAPAPAPAMIAPTPTPSPTPRSRRREAAPRVSATPPESVAPSAPAPTLANQVGHARGVPETEMTVKGLVWTVDPRSRGIAREVQDRMNLSSEGEALRMLVAMGAERLRSVLP